MKRQLPLICKILTAAALAAALWPAARAQQEPAGLKPTFLVGVNEYRHAKLDEPGSAVDGAAYPTGLWTKISQRPPGHGQQIELSRDEVKFLLNHGTIALVSAGPSLHDVPQLSVDEIRARHRQLQRDLVQLGYCFEPAQGSYGGIKEDSFLVFIPDAKKREIYDLGVKMNQDSILFSQHGQNHFVYCIGQKKGKEHPGHGWQEREDAYDFYTQLAVGGPVSDPKSNWFKFKLDVNFDVSQPSFPNSGS